MRRPHHPRRREKQQQRRLLAASVRMSALRQSHVLVDDANVGPDDEVFRQFIADRLAEADAEELPPYDDAPLSYAYEGTGATPAGSLSSLESCGARAAGYAYPPEPPPRPPPRIGVPDPPPFPPPPPPPRPYLVRLTPWYGAGEEETIF